MNKNNYSKLKTLMWQQNVGAKSTTQFSFQMYEIKLHCYL